MSTERAGETCVDCAPNSTPTPTTPATAQGVGGKGDLMDASTFIPPLTGRASGMPTPLVVIEVRSQPPFYSLYPPRESCANSLSLCGIGWM